MTGEQNRWLRTRSIDPASYDAAYEQRAAAGENVHGEADLITSFHPASVLDAGCGTGRVARELARRGCDVAGIDIDPDMLAVAREKAPGISWHTADLATVDLGRTFELIVMAGNVMIFLAPGTEAKVVANMARHLTPGGRLVAGFQIQPGRLQLADYDRHAHAAGLTLEHRWQTWDRAPWHPTATYAVTIHRS
ncbi:MAG: class I SAM-dependent methyltransferase [Dehalococcoidia bacterium]